MRLTPEDAGNKKFTTTKFRSGYDEEEVDAFLETAEQELRRLNDINQELRGQLAEALRIGVHSIGVPEFSSPLIIDAIEATAAFTAGSFFMPFMKAFASKAGEDSYSAFKELLKAHVTRRSPRQDSTDEIPDNCIIRDEFTGTSLVTPIPMSEEAIRKLCELDPSLVAGRTLVWTPSKGNWLVG